MQQASPLPSQQYMSNAPKRQLTIGGRQRPSVGASATSPDPTEAVKQNLQQHHEHIPRHHEQHFTEAARNQQRARLTQQGRSTSDSYPIQSPGDADDSDSDDITSGGGGGGYEATYPQPLPKRTLSKQEKILGIGQDDPPPGQGGPLRGNGIIGRGVSQQQSHHQRRQSHDDGALGYSGIDAWRDPNKPKRGFTLRGMRDWLDGRRERDSD